jgi:tetratricopeptide (TPR) repeat protein
MTNSTISRLNSIEKSEIKDDQELEQPKDNFDLLSDPDYLQLLDHYQKAEFSECRTLLESLELRYPGNSELQTISEDLNMRMSVVDMTSAIKKGEFQAQSKVTLRLLLFGLVGIITIILVFFASSVLFLKNTSQDNSQDVNSQASSLYLQADQLLLGGQPGPASEIVEKIKTLYPKYENLPELIERTDALLAFEAKYQEAVSLINQGEQAKAKIQLNELESEKPGMWDIPQLIAAIEKDNQIASYRKAGESAYQKEEWDKVILAYENAMLLDQTLNDPLMVEQLLSAYLNRIITMLQSESNAIEDIEMAEQYYRKAAALIPQNKGFVNQRGNLQEVSSNLLETKYTQIAKANLADKNQTYSSISKAITYLSKALNLNPKNAALQTDLANAQVYQVAFKNFVDMDWSQAVAKLEIVVATDKNFAGGNASILLYEAYYALGKQYFNAGIYLDARKYLEQAEILAWSDGENLQRLFQVQVFLGDTLGKLDDYKNAVSYYQYALTAIQIQTKFGAITTLYYRYLEALTSAANGDYQTAFGTFQVLFDGIEFVYTISEVEIDSGVCLALFASDNSSTLDAVLGANNLPKNMVVSFGRTLNVPSIQK